MSKDTLALLREIDTREQEILSNFIGERTTRTGLVHCELVPSAKNAAAALFEISEDGGISNVSTDCAVSEFLRSDGGTGKAVLLRLDDQKNGQPGFSDVVLASQKPLGASEGLYYRVPGMAVVSIEVGGAPLVRKQQLVAQLGTVVALPGGADSRAFKSKFNAVFYPESGAIRTLNLSSEPLKATTVSATGESLGSLLDAMNAQKQAGTKETEELNQLERKRKILEEKKRIADLEKELSGSH